MKNQHKAQDKAQNEVQNKAQNKPRSKEKSDSTYKKNQRGKAKKDQIMPIRAK